MRSHYNEEVSNQRKTSKSCFKTVISNVCFLIPKATVSCIIYPAGTMCSQAPIHTTGNGPNEVTHTRELWGISKLTLFSQHIAASPPEFASCSFHPSLIGILNSKANHDFDICSALFIYPRDFAAPILAGSKKRRGV